jgi:REP element-mobilizing transposase RayT
MAAFFPRSQRLLPPEFNEEAVIALINLGVRDRRRVFHGDRFACELVAESVRSLHGPRWRVLAYCLMPDHLRILILSRNGSHLEFVRLLKGRTATGLRKLGYRRVWGKDIWNRQIRREEDLADSIAHLLASRVRARIAWNWPTYPWCGSVEWPEIDEWFLGLRRGGQRFRETLVNGTTSSKPP